jgi:hypothetical protein
MAKLLWRCPERHEWHATLDGVLQGDWRQTCYVQSMKPAQQEIDQLAASHGGRCLSSYYDKQTPLQ